MVFTLGWIPGLFAFLALIPFIILYLRRPKPKEQVIPSLMFLIAENKRSKRFSFFQNFTSNLLFFIQLLILSLLALAIANPFLTLPYDITKENTVIIIDSSASMQTKVDGTTRFDQAIDKARQYLSGKNTIILAENTPLTVIEEESSDLASDVFSKLKPKATATNLGDALLLAKDILKDKPGRIVLLSDFISTEGPDVQVVKTTLTTEEKLVDFIDLSSKTENTGITRLDVGKFDSRVYIKNFDNKEKTITVSVIQQNNPVAMSDKITILPFSIESFGFETPKGISAIEIEPKDDFEPDNRAYIATPEKIKNNVVLITSRKSSHLELALRSSPEINLHVVNPPVLTITEDGNQIDPYKQDMIIFHDVDTTNVLPGTFNDIENFVRKGGSFIYAAQENIGSLNMGDLALVGFNSVFQETALVCVDTINSITRLFEGEHCFTGVAKHITGELKDKAVSFASSIGSPMLAYKELEAGHIAYYGIIDSLTEFKSEPAYPILWNELINFMAGSEDIRDYNELTGTLLTIEKQTVTTPSDTFTTSKLFMDEQGVYEIGQRKIVANLLNARESAVSKENRATSAPASSNAFVSLGDEALHDFNLVWLIAFLAFILVFIELIYIKQRGDL